MNNMSNTYNGKTLNEIADNLHPEMIPYHRELYLQNCEFVIQNEAAGFNLDYCQTVRNANHRLTCFYLHGYYASEFHKD